MQCMMKEICAQCLQQHKDPVTGEETVVFSCFNQDQSLDHVDWSNLRTRLSQNGVQEKLTKQWIDRCLKQIGAREVDVAAYRQPCRRSAFVPHRKSRRRAGREPAPLPPLPGSRLVAVRTGGAGGVRYLAFCAVR